MAVPGFSIRDEWVWTGTGYEWAGAGEPTTAPPIYAPTNENEYSQKGDPLDTPGPPVATASAGRVQALNKYLNNAKWKRREFASLINKYRLEYPKQIEAYKGAAYGALPKKEKDLWGNMYANLHQRGLNESGSFLGGAKADLASWLSGEKSAITDTAQGMEAGAQNAILTALGKPDYGALYQNWVVADDQMAAKKHRDWERRQAGGK